MLHDPENIISDITNSTDLHSPDLGQGVESAELIADRASGAASGASLPELTRGTPADLVKPVLRKLGIDPRHADDGVHAANPFVVAVHLASMGFRVLPSNRKKAGLGKGWPGRASIDPKHLLLEQVKYRPPCWSILTGRENGVIVLDIDGPEGLADLARLQAELGAMPPTWICDSPRDEGGIHIWLRPPPGTDDLMNQQPIPGTKIDVRAWHGHIAMSGSLHKTDRRYSWRPGFSPTDLPLAECPVEWWEWLPKKMFESKSPSSTSPRRLYGTRIRSEHDPASLIIGEGKGYGGFQNPIYKNAIQFFFRAGDDALAEPIISTLREMIEAAPKLPGRDVSRYMTGPDLPRIVERARDFVKSIKDE